MTSDGAVPRERPAGAGAWELPGSCPSLRWGQRRRRRVRRRDATNWHDGPSLARRVGPGVVASARGEARGGGSGVATGSVRRRGGMGVDLRFVLTGAKRVFDARPLYAQVVVTDDCNLTCQYCDEYTPGAPLIPLDELQRRIDRLDALGVQVYAFPGGEPLLHPGLAPLVLHAKSKRGGSNLVTVFTNAFLLTEGRIHDLNDAGLDFMQVSVDAIEPTAMSPKSLKSVLPRLRL